MTGYKTNNKQTHLMALNLGEPAQETYNLYSAQGITITITVALIPSIHFPTFSTVHSIIQFYMHIIHILEVGPGKLKKR